ncbi:MULTISPECIES: AAA family ATPase [Microbacterium]|uniref:AAA family ATPase n=1 Tax=Microbacterium TaxID=33882 RepID=UPI002788E349|nr:MULTISPECIES: AAA family ATPase [Microbacterium]MDQ1074181.1 shikimate kinase [Microbacterium sp. SORGH_AS_0969]MDQ1114407.1 shikimate kinase [Microbacterium testaceum]
MARVLITGMSGAGKSTVLGELAARGYRTVDTDYDGWTDGNGGPWDVDRMTALLTAESTVVVSGTSENQGSFSDRFEHVVLLSAPAEVLLERVRARANNAYGHTAAQQQEILAYVTAVEPLLRRSATLELDGTLPVGELADVVARLAGPS